MLRSESSKRERGAGSGELALPHTPEERGRVCSPLPTPCSPPIPLQPLQIVFVRHHRIEHTIAKPDEPTSRG